LGFTKSKADSNLYFKVMKDEPAIFLLYVDDLFLTREEKLITKCKKKLTSKFEMKDLGLMHYFLGLEVWQSPERIFLNQGKYAVEILKRFDMLECKSMNTPMETKLKLLVDTSSELIDATLYRQIIRLLMYLTNTRTYICFAVNTLSQFLVEPRHVHLVAAKHVIRYLKGTLDCGLNYDGDHDFTLIQIGLEVSLTRRALHDVVSVWNCYPRYLGITRRSCLEVHMVLDMEYREQELPEHGPGGPIFPLLSQFCPVNSTSFHHYRLGLASERTLAP
jgi:hypothetical protein